ncbi:hypothetical protein BOTBODRAFT_38663 [Botryobasidium botryosum FD-172 SS1]|uniref:Ribosomal protein L19 n=1 Tax=Botryobasidium botryosum (strain FD-172 SS1) TaxID=930990 RepID=A0A067LW29_BOTB1|nr:hypothetical protein BOTBODRAFT_38663 [Botryobasidium botryosum FD-172 SS1]
MNPLQKNIRATSTHIARSFTRHFASKADAEVAKPYPFSKNAIILPSSPEPLPPSLLKGTAIMAHVKNTLPPPAAKELLSTLFHPSHPSALRPGSIISLTLAHAPTNFAGVLTGVRHRGPDTSFVLRNVVQRTGVEMRFFVGSPEIKDIKVLTRAGEKGTKRMRRAKLTYLRDDASKMNAISASVRKAV